MRPVGRYVRVVLVTLGALIGGLHMISPSPALAAGPHKFSKSLAACAGGFSLPWGLAIGPAGEVFVSNKGSSVVDVYSSTGTCEAEFAIEVTETNGSALIAVDDSATSGDVYIGTSEGKVLKYEYDRTTKTATKAASLTGLTEPIAVAVDSHGDVYVADAGTGNVNKYAPDGTLITEKLISGLIEAKSIAVDSSGNIYVGSGNGVHEYSEGGECLPLGHCAAFGGVTTGTWGIAVGPEGDVYAIPEESEISVFEPNGTRVESFDPTHPIERGPGIGVVGTTVFVTNPGGPEVAEFTAAALEKFKLTVTKSSEGEVVGSKAASEIACGTGPKCEQKIEETSGGELTATGLAGFKFEEWTEGPCVGAKAKENPCKFAMPSAETNVAVKYAVSAKHPLTVHVTGEGEVNSSPGTGIKGCKSGSGTCKEEFEGTVTLTATAEPGSVFAGWLECETETAGGACEVEMTATHKVQAEFMLEGKEGKNGESVTVRKFVGSENGCAEGGTEIKLSGGATTYVCDGANGAEGVAGREGAAGKEGSAGANGTPGDKGANGSSGSNGAQGPAGSAGKEGPPGKVELVTCKTIKKKGKNVQQCTTKVVSGTLKFTASASHATLSRHGVVYATGAARDAHGNTSLRLVSVRKLRSGRYTLTLISGSGRHERIRTEPFMLL